MHSPWTVRGQITGSQLAARGHSMDGPRTAHALTVGPLPSYSATVLTYWVFLPTGWPWRFITLTAHGLSAGYR